MEERRWRRHRWPGPRRYCSARAGCHARRGASADRLCLSLRIGHAVGRGGAGHLVHGDAGRREMNLPLLSLCTFVPLIGAALILLMPKPDNARWIALGTSVLVFALPLLVWAGFDASDPGFQLVEKHDCLGCGISYH